MKKSILVFNGSTRDQGNTDTLVEKYIEGLEYSGLSIQYFRLKNMNIGNCVGCCKCITGEICGQEDDMTKIRGMIEKCEALVFASPIYWCEITGLMKTFLDRFYFYHHPNTAGRIAGKKGIIITTMGEFQNIGYETEILNEFYRRMFKSLKIVLIDHLIFPGLMEADSAKYKPDYISQVYDMGKRLINKLN